MSLRQHDCSIRSSRSGVSLPEVLVAIGVIGLLMALLSPAIQQSRERARAITCRDRERQLVLACYSHETFHQTFPATSNSWLDEVNGQTVLRLPISTHRHLMAHLDVTMFRAIDFDDPTAPVVISTSMGSISSKNQILLKKVVPVFVCPSDTARPGATNYRCNMGASVEIFAGPVGSNAELLAASGAFINGRSVNPSEIRDGLTQTALLSERVLGDGDPAHYSPFRDRYSPSPIINSTADAEASCPNYATATPAAHDSFAGWNWLLGGRIHTWYFHISGPNSTVPDCSSGGGTFSADGGPGLYAARSLHPGGVNVAFADGSVRFVASTIDLKVWQALGTRNAQDRSSGDP